MNLDISTTIAAVLFAVTGLILFLVGTKKSKRLLCFLGISFLIGAGISIFVKSAELRDILTAAATVIAVFLAAFSFDESRRLRKDSIDHESRDREERLLDEIIEWAESILSVGRSPDLLYEIRTKDVKDLQDFTGIVSEDAIYRFNPVKIRSRYIIKIAARFGENLQSAVKVATTALFIQADILKQARDGKTGPQVVGEQRKTLDESASKVIDEATSFKMSLLKS